MTEDYKRFQKKIYSKQNIIWKLLVKEKYKSEKNLAKIINDKNEKFLNNYRRTFEQLSDENKKNFDGVLKAVNDFALSNYDFTNDYKGLKQ
ncbi:hypothetical protein LRB67_05180 [Borreliella bissettiae]|uniref:hypothetical protein n=1 Tax=Borrelia bissettiae TaxID=64897 RepID=UPI001E3C9407|nr:hypothetical protein [Borreliella bissettiae]MCD2401646.1 hypothetical protein [Borreliella bissettiae]